MTHDAQIQMVDRGPDTLLKEFAQLAKEQGEPGLRIRMQPACLNPEKKVYAALPGVSWIMDIATVEGVQDLRKALDVFFALAVLLKGPTELLDYMEQAKKMVEESRA